jgi:Chalcone isomerase-like
MTTRRAALTQAMRAALVCCAGGLTATAHANLEDNTKQTSAAAPTAVRTFFRGAPRLIGQHRFTYWGFEVYDASLWGNTAFAPHDWAKQSLVLELRYLRDFKGADIAQRSIDEMQGQRTLSAAQKQTWSGVLQSLIPNVRSGERLTGIYTPDKGMQLLHQDRLLGEVTDLDLAQRFFGIWLAPETSQRQLRQQLLAGAQP